MNGLTQQQKDRISRLSKQISTAKDEVWYAFETTMMSDAKSFVYELWSAVKDDEDIPASIKKDLFSILDTARSYLIGEGTTYDRSQKAHAELAVAERYLKDILAQDTE